MLAFNKPVSDPDCGKNIAMQIASAAPVAIDESGVSQEVKDNEVAVAIETTKAEQVQKAVEAALKKAGFNLYICENEEHIAEGIAKGNITEAQAEEIRNIKTTVAAEKAANLPEAMIQNIAKGRMAKFFKESCLLNQEFIQDSKLTVTDYLKATDKDLTVVTFNRFTLRAE
jgi:elongation factor Ts